MVERNQLMNKEVSSIHKERNSQDSNMSFYLVALILLCKTFPSRRDQRPRAVVWRLVGHAGAGSAEEKEKHHVSKNMPERQSPPPHTKGRESRGAAVAEEEEW